VWRGVGGTGELRNCSSNSGGLTNPKSAGHVSSWRPRDEFQLESKHQLLQNSFLLQGGQSFLLRPTVDWRRPSHILKDNLLYFKRTDLNVNLIF
jgi:hypothetical protein